METVQLVRLISQNKMMKINCTEWTSLVGNAPTEIRRGPEFESHP